jgi:hypothetical protein
LHRIRTESAVLTIPGVLPANRTELDFWPAGSREQAKGSVTSGLPTIQPEFGFLSYDGSITMIRITLPCTVRLWLMSACTAGIGLCLMALGTQIGEIEIVSRLSTTALQVFLAKHKV